MRAIANAGLVPGHRADESMKVLSSDGKGVADSPTGLSTGMSAEGCGTGARSAGEDGCQAPATGTESSAAPLRDQPGEGKYSDDYCSECAEGNQSTGGKPLIRRLFAV